MIKKPFSPYVCNDYAKIPLQLCVNKYVHQAPEETMVIHSVIYPEIILIHMLKLSGIYMYFLGPFYFHEVNHTSCVAWSLKSSGGYCHRIVVQIHFSPASKEIYCSS